MRIRSVLTHSGQAVLEGALIAMLVVGLMAGTTFAAKGGGGAKPGGGSGGTIALAMVGDANGDRLPNWGDQVTFNVSSTATTEPHARIQCFQSGALVLSAQAGFYASYPWPWLQTITLSSSSWTGGAADCTAQIYYFAGTKTVWSTSLSFQVGA